MHDAHSFSHTRSLARDGHTGGGPVGSLRAREVVAGYSSIAASPNGVATTKYLVRNTYLLSSKCLPLSKVNHVGVGGTWSHTRREDSILNLVRDICASL